MSHKALTVTPFIRDGKGTWFAPRSLRIALLSRDEISELESGVESILRRADCTDLGVLLRTLSRESAIEWALVGSRFAPEIPLRQGRNQDRMEFCEEALRD